MMLLICGAKSTSATVMASAITANITIAVPTVRPPFCFSPQPICWPSKIVVPMAKLLTRFVSVIMICEPVDTAETSADVANLPTINRSTAPYMACKNRANSTGSANKINGCKITLGKVVFFSIFSIFVRQPVFTTGSYCKKLDKDFGHFSPASYPAIVSYEQSTLR